MPQDQPSEISQNVLERLHFVPELPLNYLPRPTELEALKELILAEQNSSVVIAGKAQPASPRIGVHGMGGIGKSVLAAAVVCELEIRERFPDGIFWLTIGQTPQIKVLQGELAFTLSGNQCTFETEHQGKMRLGELLKARRCLLVLDDVWESNHAKPFNEFGPGCRMLITTRISEITKALGAKLWSLDLLNDTQAQELLASWAGAELPLPPVAVAVAEKCGNLPLALSLAGALVGDGIQWGSVLEALTKANLEYFDQELGSVQLALKASLDALTTDELAAYLKLAVFPEDVAIPEATLGTLWHHTAGLDAGQVERFILKFKNRALLRAFGTSPTQLIELHDLQHLYLKKLAGNLQPLHAELVKAYWNVCSEDWHTGPNDGYFFERLPSHLAQAGLNEELRNLLFDFRWMEAKLGYLGVSALMADYQTTSDTNVRLIYQTLQLSSHIVNKDRSQLRSQLWGRLVGFSSSKIQALLNQARETCQEIWLRPTFSCLTLPGGHLLFTLEGHQAEVTAIAVFPDGKRIVSGSGNGTLKIWDLETRTELATLTGHTEVVTAVAVLPDGRRLVSASYDETLKVWEVATGAELATLTGHTLEVMAVAVLSDGRRLVSASWDKTLKVWEVATGAELATLTGHTEGVTAVAVLPDGRRLVSASDDHTLKVWEAETGTELATLTGHTEVVTAVAVLPDGRRLVSASWDQTLKVWEVATGAELATLTGHTNWVTAVAVLPDGRRLVSASWDHTLKVWEVATGAELATLRGHTDWVTAVAVLPDGRRLVSASYDKTLKVWEVETGAELATLTGHTDWVRAVAVLPDGRRLVSASDDQTLKVWEVATGAELATLTGHTREVTAVAVLPDGRRLVSASYDKTLKVREVATGAELATLRGHTDWVTAVAVLPDGRRLVSASADKTLKVWEVATGAELATLTGHTDWVTAVAVLPDGRRLVSASWDKTLKVWEVATGAELATLTGHTERVTAVAVLPDGRRLVSASDDQTLKVWEVATGAELATLRGHTDRVTAVAVLPDGRRLVSASDDQTLKVWNVETQQVLLTYFGDAPFTACAVSPDGKTIFAGDTFGRIHFLKLEEGCTQPLITNKPNKFFFPEPEIRGNKTPMPLSDIARKRLKDLEELLSIQYDKLFEFQKDISINASANSRFELKERIKREIYPTIAAHAQEYFGMMQQTGGQAKTEILDQLLVSIRTQLVSADLPELAQKINELSLPSSVPASMSTSNTAPIPAPVQPAYVNQPTGGSMIKILFLAANPRNTTKLRIDEEIREIKSKLRASDHRDRFQIEQEWAVRVSDLQEHLLRHRPHIVHFSGHGNKSGEIALEDVNGNYQPVPKPALKRLFTTLKDNIRCVVLNACYSEAQAQALSEAIDCVVGMNDSIDDKAAIAFAASFYQALGFGRNLYEAYDLGCTQIAMHNIPEEDTPQLLHQPTVDPKSIVLTNPQYVPQPTVVTTTVAAQITPQIDQGKLLETLTKITDVNFGTLVFLLDAGKDIPGDGEPQKRRAVKLLEWADSRDRLPELVTILETKILHRPL